MSGHDPYDGQPDSKAEAAAATAAAAATPDLEQDEDAGKADVEPAGEPAQKSDEAPKSDETSTDDADDHKTAAKKPARKST